MIPANARIIGRTSFDYKEKKYDVVTYVDPHHPDRVSVEPTENGNPVVVTFPDGHQVTRTYSVDFVTASDMKMGEPSIDAVDHLVQTAIGDIKASF